MKKVLNWIVNHLRITLAIVTFTVTVVVIGCVMLGSYQSYQKYEAKYNANDLEIRAKLSAEPKRIDIQDDFVSYKADGSIKSKKSSNKNVYTAWSENLNVQANQDDILVTGDSVLDSYVDSLKVEGTVSLNLTLSEKSFVDIVFVVSSEKENTDGDETYYGVKDLISNVDFIVNGATMEGDIDLKNSGNGVEWHSLVMGGFALPEGELNIQIKNKSGKFDLMPQLRNITLFANAEIGEAQVEAA